MGIIRLIYENISKKPKNKKAIAYIEKQESNSNISECYEPAFIQMMERHNEKVIEELEALIDVNMPAQILDVTGGRGQNLSILKKQYSDADYTLIERNKENIIYAKAILGEEVTYINRSSLQYLQVCLPDTFDIILCMWPNKATVLDALIEECTRVLKPQGKLLIITSLRDTLPEIVNIYHKLFIKYNNKVNAVKLVNGLPTDIKKLNKKCEKMKLKTHVCKEIRHISGFASAKVLVSWILQSGVMTDYEAILSLRDKKVRDDMIAMLEEKQINWVTQRFVYGIWEKN